MGDLVDLTKKADDGPEVVYLDEHGNEIGSKPETGGHFPRGRVTTEAFKNPEYDEALLKEAAAFIEQNEIDDGGGWRQDEHRKQFWLRLPRLLEYEKADRRITSDKDFWKWFRKFRDEHNIGGGRGKVSWSSYYKDDDKPKNYLKDWWQGWGWSGSSSWGSSTSELGRRLAVALGAVATTVGVINNTGKRYRVEFADDQNTGPVSATMYDEQLIVVSPQALLKAKDEEQADAIEVTTGFALHEGSHVEYSEVLTGVLKTPTLLEPLTVSALLHNILEDLRIERLTGDKFPGFVDYFVKANAFLWDTQKDKVPKVWGPKLGDKLNGVILMAKWPVEFEPIAKADPGLAGEWNWWRAWAEQYKSGKNQLRPSIIAALRRLAEDPQTQQEMDQLTAAEQKAAAGWGTEPQKLNDKQFKDFLDQLKQFLGDPSSMKPCPSPTRQPGKNSPKIKLTPEQAAEVKKLINEQFQQSDPSYQFPDRHGWVDPKINRSRPEESERSRRFYKAPRGTIVNRMKSAFFFRKARPLYSDRLLKSGAIDEDELWRAAGGDFRVFEQKIHKETPDTQVTMLVDVSGSMAGTLLGTAQELATIMIECLRLAPGVRVRVRGHTNDDHDVGLYRIWEKGDPVTRLGVLQAIPSGVNWDGYAIDACAAEMVADQRPGESMVLIVLSDGRPNGSGGHYSGKPAMDHVRAVNTHYARKGVTVIQIAVSGGLRAEDQARMYDNWIPFETPEKLPQQLTRTLIKLFSGGDE